MVDDTAPLASLSLTHVYYDPKDPVSLLCAYLALLPQALCIVYITLIISTREVEILFMFVGQLGCEVINFLLKRLIKEERPRRIHGKGYGMPSSHAQFVAFWSVSLALFLLLRHKPRQSHGNGRVRPWTLLERAAISLAAGGLTAATAWSRVYLNYHTSRQVLVGSATGFLLALAWYGVTSAVRYTGLMTRGLELSLARALRVRDLIISEDMCQAGWEKWELTKTGKAKAG